MRRVTRLVGMQLPAICKTCGEAFPSGFAIEGGVAVEGCTAGPCPACGGVGEIVDGTYRLARGVIELAGRDSDQARLRRVAQILVEAKRRESSPDDVLQAVEQEDREFADLLRGGAFGPETWPTWLNTVLMVLIAVLMD